MIYIWNPNPLLLFSPVVILSDVKPDDFPFDWYAIARSDHFWFRSRMDAFFTFARRHVDLKSPANVLEIGCGNGLVRKQLEEKTSWITDGADINIEALQFNQGLKGTTYLYNIHERKEELKDKYDHVILFDVLEHIPDTRQFLESCLFHLKPGGLLFINVPSLNKYKSHYDEVVGHIRRYDKEMMAKEFEHMNVQIIGQRYWALSLVPLLVLRKWRLNSQMDVKSVVEKGLKPPSGLINKLMYALLRSENALFSRPFTGASLMAAVKKL